MRFSFRRGQSARKSAAAKVAPRATETRTAASETEVAEVAAVAAPTVIREAAAAARPTRLRAERVVDGIVRVTAAVPSVGPTRKAWTRLGFAPSRLHDFDACAAFDVHMEGCSLRFLAPPRRPANLPLPKIVSDRLIHGAGLLGWSWSCEDTASAAESIERTTSTSFVEATGQRQEPSEGAGLVLLPPALTPGARTMLECNRPAEHTEHPNGVTHMDHLVLTVSDVDSATHIYEKNFGLSATCLVSQERRHSYLKVGDTTLELVGPLEPGSGPLAGALWGLAFRSPDLDTTVECLHGNGVPVRSPHPAREGGRITALGLPLGGIQIAFMGK